MTEFWESSFRNKQEMWGWEPAHSAKMTLDLFQKYGIQNILIPGFGYGRNAKIFLDQGIKVTGIEISETAIELSRQHLGNSIKVHHGATISMPFDQEHYDGIYCYALVHLLNVTERKKLIADCYQQLSPGGYMVFVTISKLDFRYSQGTLVGKDTYETHPGVQLYFYDESSIDTDFQPYGLVGAEIIDEHSGHLGKGPLQKFWYVTCKKDYELIHT